MDIIQELSLSVVFASLLVCNFGHHQANSEQQVRCCAVGCIICELIGNYSYDDDLRLGLALRASVALWF